MAKLPTRQQSGHRAPQRAPRRPQTLREVEAQRQAEQKVGQITVMNISEPSQLIKIHLKAPKGVDFYIAAQDIALPRRGSRHTFRKDRIIPGQIERLQKQRKIQVISDTDRVNS
jgi:hypothetical protein